MTDYLLWFYLLLALLGVVVFEGYRLLSDPSSLFVSKALLLGYLIAAAGVLGIYAGIIYGFFTAVAIVFIYVFFRNTPFFKPLEVGGFVITFFLALVFAVMLYILYYVVLILSTPHYMQIAAGSALLARTVLGGIFSLVVIYFIRFSALRGLPWPLILKAVVVVMLIGGGALAGFCLIQKEDALPAASRRGYVWIAKALVSAGYPVDRPGKRFGPPLVEAAAGGHVDIVRLLLDFDADSGALKNGATALMKAAGHGHTLVVQTLLDGGVEPDQAGSGGWTALMAAAKMGAKRDTAGVVRLLLDEGADAYAVNRDGKTALDIAREHGAAGIEKILREAKSYETPLIPGEEAAPQPVKEDSSKTPGKELVWVS